MNLVKKNKDIIYWILPYKIKALNDDELILKIKNIFSKYNKRYNFLDPGLYEIEIYFHKIVGTLFKIEKLDSYIYQNEIDLKIEIKNDIKLYFIEEETKELNKKIELDNISLHTFLKLVEHGEITTT